MSAKRVPPFSQGEHNGNAKLTPAKVREIHALWATKAHNREDLAKRFEVSEHTIWAILSGRLWRHLFPGKQGHSLRYGEGHAGHKLTEAQVIEIRRRLKDGERVSQLASAFGVAKSVVSEIKTRKAWKHLP